MVESAYGWRLAGASVQGVSHKRLEMPCQDAHAVALLQPDAVVLVTADGAGSAELSATGARIAVDTALASLAAAASTGIWCPDNSQRLLTEAAATALLAVEAEAASLEVPARALACTLILCVLLPHFAAALQIGDGACVVRLAGDASTEPVLMALTTPTHGEYLNETTFLVSPNAIQCAQFGSTSQTITGAALFTDGLQEIALNAPDYRPHGPFFAPLLRFIEAQECPAAAEQQLRSFLESPRLSNRTDDDLTLLLAARAASEETPPLR